jgi:hypothetical protein
MFSTLSFRPEEIIEGDDLRSGGTLCLMFASNGWRSSQNGWRESAKERKEDSVQLWNCPTQAKIGLNGPPALNSDGNKS